ncbi:MAG: class I SAM-dependent methyltransferase [Woeseiaceae bacterium]|nr:class I SAM-dependent methyltransferase [Woeseiaceae bacterium]
MNPREPDIPPAAKDYDRKAEDYSWRGPELAFGLSHKFINRGECVLDIGIGTGLSSILFHESGLRVYGMDKSAEMLEVCRQKGLAADLRKHDLTIEPYPYDTASLDHAICIGVLEQIKDLTLVFREVSRILRDKGIFAFTVADRGPGEGAEYAASPPSTQSGPIVTMYRRSTDEVSGLLKSNNFYSLKSVEFFAYLDLEKTVPLRLKLYVVRRIVRI